MAKNVTSQQQPTHDEISARAHKIYESEGRPEGKAMEHWLQAEAQIIAEHKATAAKAAAKTSPVPNMPTGNAPASGSSGNRSWSGNPRQTASHN